MDSGADAPHGRGGRRWPASHGIAVLVAALFVGCSATPPDDDRGAPVTNPVVAEAATAVETVAATVAERIGAGRAVTAAVDGETTLVATTAGVQLVRPQGSAALPVTTTTTATSVSLSPDGSSALVTWPDATELWRLSEPLALVDRQAGVLAAAFTGSGDAVLVSATSIRVLTADGATVAELEAVAGTEFRSLSTSDGDGSSWFVPMSGDGDPGSDVEPTVVIGDGGGGEPRIVPLGLDPSFAVNRAIPDRAGDRLALWGVDRSVAAHETIIMWDVTTGESLWSVEASAADAWTVTDDGGLFIAGHPSSRLIAPDGAETSVAVPAGTEATAVDVPVAVHALASGNIVAIWRNGVRTVHDVSGRVVDRSPGTGRAVVDSTLLPGRSGLLTVDFLGEIQILDADGDLAEQVEGYVAADVNDVAISSDDRLAVATSSGLVTIRGRNEEDPGAGPTTELAHPEGTVDSVAFSPAGQRVVTGVGERRGPYSFDDTVSIWDPATESRLQIIGGGGEDVAGCLRFENVVRYSPDGSFIVAASHDFTINVIDPDSYEILRTFETRGGPTRDIAISSDNSRMATTSDDSTLRLWDVATGELLAEHRAIVGGYFSLEFLPDSPALLVSDTTGQLSIIDSESGSVLTVFEGLSSRETGPSLSPDGRLVAAAEGSLVRLWSVDTGQVVSELAAHSGLVQATAFSPDGSELVSGATDGTVVVWDLDIPTA